MTPLNVYIRILLVRHGTRLVQQTVKVSHFSIGRIEKGTRDKSYQILLH